jgi:hypothetical protein
MQRRLMELRVLQLTRDMVDLHHRFQADQIRADIMVDHLREINMAMLFLRSNKDTMECAEILEINMVLLVDIEAEEGHRVVIGEEEGPLVMVEVATHQMAALVLMDLVQIEEAWTVAWVQWLQAE